MTTAPPAARSPSSPSPPTPLDGTLWRVNAEIPGAELRRSWPPLPGSIRILERAVELGQVSNQGIYKLLRVAWTIADLAGSARPGPDEITDSLRLYLGTAAARS